MTQRHEAAARPQTLKVPHYYVSAGKRNVKLNQDDQVGTPREQFGPYTANDKRQRLVTVFAVNDVCCESILADWRSRIAAAESR